MNVIASWIELTLADGVTFSAEPHAGGAGYVLKNRALKQVKQLVTATLRSLHYVGCWIFVVNQFLLLVDHVVPCCTSQNADREILIHYELVFFNPASEGMKAIL